MIDLSAPNPSSDLVSMLGGRLQFHLEEPVVIIDDYEVRFGKTPTRVLQALAIPIGAYVDKWTLYSRIWEEESFDLNPIANARINSAIVETRKRLSGGFGPGSGMHILTSTSSSKIDSVRYALYEPPHLFKK